MKPVITVVSLGPGDPELMTMQTVSALRKARRLILRTRRHAAAPWLEENGIAFDALDEWYDRYDDFDALHQALARHLWEQAQSCPVTYAVMDASCDASVAALSALCPEDGTLTLLPGLSLTDVYLSELPGATSRLSGLRTLPATACAAARHDPRLPLLITELDSPVLAGEVKLWLGDLYGDESPVVFFPSRVKAHRRPVSIQLMALDRQHTYDHTCAVYVPASPLRERSRFCFEDLLEVMEILRGENGCPWDREQTHKSLRKYLLEEAYEAAGAIDEEDPDHLADELGDVLLQVVFHASVGASHGEFAIGDVTTDICRKMIYRHAHIFGTDHCATAGEVADNWEKLKKAEKGLHTQSEVLADVSRSLPALTRAHKVQKKAAQVGFDWDAPLEALPKVHEEADEVRAELEAGRDPAEELGDLLFSCVNVTRLSGLDAERLLELATEKFIRRFSAMENLIKCDGKSLEGLTLSEMDVYWNRVKSTQNCCGTELTL